MYFLYNFILILSGILLSPVILLLFLIKPKLRAGFWQKIGFYTDINKSAKPLFWFHAVSVGEVNAIEALIKRFRQEFPDYKIVLSTITQTGQQIAQNKLSKSVDSIIYFPYDFNFSIKSAVNAIKPKAVIIAETEIWPGFSHELNAQGIPLILVNGRFSPNSYKNYKKLKFFFKNILKNYSLILMQSEEYRKKIIDIGAQNNKVEVMGNLKFNITGILTDTEIIELKKSLGLNNERVLIAGSTHQGEDEIILSVYNQLKEHFPDLKLIIAPRHPERNNHVLKLISGTEFKYGLRSNRDSFNDNEIILLDVMGELGKLYAASHIAFIGGSFSGTGGHNPLEAAVYKIPVLSGPTIFNFKDIYNYMTEHNSVIITKNEQELYKNINNLLIDQNKYNKISSACINIFESNKDVLDLTLEKLRQFT